LLAFVIASSNGLIFQCQFNTGPWLVLGNIYECVPQIFNAGDELVIRGDHINGRNNSHVEGLQIISQNLNELPQELGEFFPNLIGLKVVLTNLTSISADDLRQFPKLQRIDFFKTLIKSLNGDLFTVVPRLKRFDFDENQLQHVGFNLLAWTPELTRASFNKNPCINQVAQEISEIVSLNNLLPVLCPPLATPPPPSTTTLAAITTTPDSNECPGNCSERIESLENRINELEKIVRELSANPCSRGQ
jgi:hypothetical protein